MQVVHTYTQEEAKDVLHAEIAKYAIFPGERKGVDCFVVMATTDNRISAVVYSFSQICDDIGFGAGFIKLYINGEISKQVYGSILEALGLVASDIIEVGEPPNGVRASYLD